jgi:hypothetical protein
MNFPEQLATYFVATILLAPAQLNAQVALHAGGAVWYGPYPPSLVIVPSYAYGAYRFSTPLSTGLPSCYRFGRCSAFELHLFRDRPDRFERLAPAVPPGDVPPPVHMRNVFPPDITRTPDENIVPEYRGKSLPREDYSESGKLRATR